MVDKLSPNGAPMSFDPAKSLPLSVPVFHILVALADQDLHGYAIIAEIRERTEGEVTLTASTLYAAVARLLSQGHIEEVEGQDDEKDDSRRRYYRISRTGRDLAASEVQRLERAVSQARAKNKFGSDLIRG
jgi:DNA-binding PadR family transcriptional regulator